MIYFSRDGKPDEAMLSFAREIEARPIAAAIPAMSGWRAAYLAKDGTVTFREVQAWALEGPVLNPDAREHPRGTPQMVMDRLAAGIPVMGAFRPTLWPMADGVRMSPIGLLDVVGPDEADHELVARFDRHLAKISTSGG